MFTGLSRTAGCRPAACGWFMDCEVTAKPVSTGLARSRRAKKPIETGFRLLTRAANQPCKGWPGAAFGGKLRESGLTGPPNPPHTCAQAVWVRFVEIRGRTRIGTVRDAPPDGRLCFAPRAGEPMSSPDREALLLERATAGDDASLSESLTAHHDRLVRGIAARMPAGRRSAVAPDDIA